MLQIIKSPFVLLVLLALLFSCNRSKDCTIFKCECPDLTLRVATNFIGDEDKWLNHNELQSFKLIRTDKDFNPIDTVSLELLELPENENYTKWCDINKTEYSIFKDVKEYNFILTNSLLSIEHKISEFSYKEKDKKTECSSYQDACKDEYIYCTDYYEKSFTINGIRQDDFIIKITKQ